MKDSLVTQEDYDSLMQFADDLSQEYPTTMQDIRKAVTLAWEYSRFLRASRGIIGDS